jgi:alpha-D-ribose 1-methylphosphonate 5-triphosphate synthase subunit PhnH
MGVSLAQLKENRFDFVHDSQRVFRVLMMAMAFPGEIRTMEEIPLSLDRKEHGFIMQPFLTLLDLETNFHVHAKDPGIREEVENYLEISTNAARVGWEKADFILCLEPSLNGRFAGLKKGSLAIPHKSATVFYLADRVLPSPGDGAIGLTLSGPGIKTRKRVFISGIERDEMGQWSAHRGGYPLGIDICIVSRAGEIIGIPRSVSVHV